MVGAWFSGYPEGVKAASKTVRVYRDVQVSSMINAALQPATDVWAPYTSAETDGQPPIVTGQDLEMPPLPESSPMPIPENGAPLGSNPLGPSINSLGTEETLRPGPLSAEQRPLSRLIR
jgi:hypothetical protein